MSFDEQVVRAAFPPISQSQKTFSQFTQHANKEVEDLVGSISSKELLQHLDKRCEGGDPLEYIKAIFIGT